VTDFGLAKEVDSENSAATRDGTIMGSPSYMPPEQARGQIAEVSPKSDQYSMGAVLYQLLTAQPFITDRPLRQ
jgi:serine/threonine protein kinase